MGAVARVDLAHAEDFRLGRLTVRPALRQLLRDDGGEEVLEPRVMQVLVALARADGAILSRDDLTSACWEGRVVGEDAINRVISRLRRSAAKIGEGGFRIETLTKVGYRLVVADGEVAPPRIADVSGAETAGELRKLRLDRRAMLIGAGAAVVAGGGYVWLRHGSAGASGPPSDVAELVEQAQNAVNQGSRDSALQAVGLMQRVVARHPDYADGWGFLGLLYAGGAGGVPPQLETTMRARADEAIARALKLDPDNATAAVARIALVPSLGTWLGRERDLLAVLARHRDNEYANHFYVGLLGSVGRYREAAAQMEADWKRFPTSPGIAYARIAIYWAANRIDEADAAAAEGAQLYPAHYAVWFTRLYLLMYTGRAQQALAMLRDTENLPAGIPDWNFAMVADAAQAMITRTPADIDKAMASNLAGSRKASGFAENAIQYASALGRLDTCFEIAQAYYFGRGFETGPLAYSPEQKQYGRANSRRTNLLFVPSTAAMRGDPRFRPLVEELGLERYWKESGHLPDYRGG